MPGSTYMSSLKSQIHRTERKVVVSRSGGGEGNVKLLCSGCVVVQSLIHVHLFVSTLDLPVLYRLSELAQTHVH